MATDLNNQTLRRPRSCIHASRRSAGRRSCPAVGAKVSGHPKRRVSRDCATSASPRPLIYLLPDVEDALSPSHFESVRTFVKSCRGAGPTLTVIRTTSGAAQSVALAIDKARWTEVVGTLAGDDTIFIACDSARGQRRLLERLRTTFAR